MGLLLAQGFENPFSTLFWATAYNFYPMFALLIVLIVIFTKKDFGPMAKAERRAIEEGKLLADDAQPMIADELTGVEPKENVRLRSRNMILPTIILVSMMPVMLAYTGWDAAIENRGDSGFFGKFFFAIGQGSGSTAVLTALIISLLTSMIYYKIQGIFDLKEMVDLTLKGISGMMPLALLMLMAFAIGAVCKLSLIHI